MNNKKRNLEETRNTPSYIPQPNSECTIHRKNDNEVIHINPIKWTPNKNTNYEYKSMEIKKQYVFAMDNDEQ